MSAPPAICIGAMRSPRKIAASATVTAGSTVDSVDARVGPMRFNPAKNQVIAATVDTSAIARTAPPGGGGWKRWTARQGERGKRDGGARDHDGRHRERVDASGDVGRHDDVDRVDEGRQYAERDACRVSAPRTAGERRADRERRAGQRDRERGRRARPEPVVPAPRGEHRDDCRVKVEEQGDQSRRRERQRGEEAGGLRGVADGAQCHQCREIPSARPRDARDRAGPDQERTGDDEAQREERRRVDAVGVRVAREDRHRAERRRGGGDVGDAGDLERAVGHRVGKGSRRASCFSPTPRQPVLTKPVGLQADPHEDSTRTRLRLLWVGPDACALRSMSA